jgi:phosphoribosylglycinamide formyltransferase-1
MSECANIAIMSSSAGSNFEALVCACRRGEVRARVVLLVSDNPKAGVVERANKLGIPVYIAERSVYRENFDLWDQGICGAMRESAVDYVFLAGFLKKVGPQLIEQYRGRILNTHPSLLPKHGGPGMYGRRVHAAVLEAGDPVTGISIHEVTSHYDEGQVVFSREMPVESYDTPESLEHRLKSLENQWVVDFWREYI